VYLHFSDRTQKINLALDIAWSAGEAMLRYLGTKEESA